MNQAEANQKGDALQLFHNAQCAAAKIPGARLVAFDHGGYLLLPVERETIQAEIRQFILAHAG
jgi:2-hydroxy-6-oxonona-2,4-dienedioate hydrolase